MILIQIAVISPSRSIAEAGLKIKELTGIDRNDTRLRKFMKRYKFQFLKTGHKPLAIVLYNARYQNCFLVTAFGKSL